MLLVLYVSGLHRVSKVQVVFFRIRAKTVSSGKKDRRPDLPPPQQQQQQQRERTLSLEYHSSSSRQRNTSCCVSYGGANLSVSL